nr:hypothetical protein [Tanacetum cinerariifolium]
AQEEEIGRLKERVQVLEDREDVASKTSGEDAPIKGRSNNGGEAAAERISNDSEEIARVLTSMDAGEGSGKPTEPHHTHFPEDRATIAKSSTLPHDSAPRVTFPAADEGREAAAERISIDSEEIARVLTSMDAATILAGETNVPTGSGFIPTAGPPVTVISTGSEVGPTASPIVKRRKGKEVMVESDTPKKKKLQEQIDAQVARELEKQ